MYPALDFGARAQRVRVRVACGRRGCGALELRLDSPQGWRIARLPIPGRGGWQRFATVVGRLHAVRGEHNLYVLWRGAPGRRVCAGATAGTGGSSGAEGTVPER